MKEETLNNRLDRLFGRWADAIAANEGISPDEVLFTRDGLMYKNDISIAETDSEWHSLDKRVMFVAKDNNAQWSDDIRFWLRNMPEDERKHITQKDKNRKLQVPFLRRMAYLLWGIHKIDSSMDWWYDEITKHLEEVTAFFNTYPFALVESKKQPGSSSIDDTTLAKHISNYESFLKEEIEILNPNCIVCFGSEVFNGMLNIHSKHILKEFASKKIYEVRTPEGELKCTIIHVGHPSSRRGYEKYYEENMFWIRKYIKGK